MLAGILLRKYSLLTLGSNAAVPQTPQARSASGTQPRSECNRGWLAVRSHLDKDNSRGTLMAADHMTFLQMFTCS